MKKSREISSLTTERSMKRHLEHICIKVVEEMFITKWIFKINPSNTLKSKYWTKHERKQRYDFRGLIVRIIHQVWFVKITEITNERDYLKIKD